jgi:uncharacterized protein YecE (DUF72 family)
MAKARQIRIGTSGYQYDHWRGIFYPEELPKKQWLAMYVCRFDTVEINNTFYHLPQASTFDHWRSQAPPGFCFALKYSRFGTHLKHLKDPPVHLKPFVENAERLKPYLGPILVQLPPQWGVDTARLEQFLAEAPSRLRWAIEFRHPSWLCEPVYRILREHKAALCIHDKLDHPRVVTAGWTYIRYHGGAEEGGNYSQEFLRAEAGRIRGYLDEGLDVYAYFNNDQHGHAFRNAADLHRLVGRAAGPRRTTIKSDRSQPPRKRGAVRSSEQRARHRHA